MDTTSFSELPEVYIEKNGNLITLELKTKDGWLKGEFTFEPFEESRFIKLPSSHAPKGQISTAFFRRSPRQREESLVLAVVKVFQSYATEVLPQFTRVSEIFTKHGHPIEDVDRVSS